MKAAATCAAFFAVSFVGVVVAQQHTMPQPAGTSGASPAAHIMIAAAEESWTAAPPSLPAGAQLSVLEGDPTKAGPFTIQVKMPDGYRVAPHYHPTDERQTVVEGTLMMGMGKEWTDSEMKALTPGSFVMLPKGNAHYVVAKGQAVLQIQATGPYDLTYVNASDDPRKK